MQGLWKWLSRTGPSGFGSSSTAEQVTEGIDSTNLTAIVTDLRFLIIVNGFCRATSGIGKETARVLAMRGATVIIPARSMESGLMAKESLLQENPKAKVEVMELDLASINSVKSFASNFNSLEQPLNILVNNAGIMACPFQLSVDGIEMQFATNHLGHFLLTNLLLNKLKTTAKETGIEGRIVNVSSLAHRRTCNSKIRFDKINDPSGYKPHLAYGQSKLANILHANELSRRLKEEGANVTANSLHPGVIPTNIIRYIKFASIPVSLVKYLLKSIPQGSATTCYVALHPNVKGVTGKYFANCNEAHPMPHARDKDLAKKLWDFTQELLDNHKTKPQA